MENKKGNLNVVVSFIIVIALIGFIIYSIVTKPIDDISSDSLALSNNSAQTEMKDTNTETPNMEQIAKNGDTLVMNYTGRLVDGTVFDSNVDPKFNHVQPFEFTLGAGQVIAGWDEGLLGMKVGEKKTLTITPDKGYGERGVPGVIPANATLIFDVELVGIK